MAKARVFQRADGGISVLSLNERHRAPGETDEAFLDREAAKDPRLAGAAVVTNCCDTDDASVLPQSRRFRNCWRPNGTGTVHVDLPMARAQRLGEIRAERGRRLAASDPEILRAREQGDVAKEAALVTYRQALRDLPVTVQADLVARTTPDSLAAYEPTWPVVPSA